MEYNYSLTTSYDGKLIRTLRTADMLEIIDAWNKCVDSGDAKEYATYNLSDPNGKMYTKNFYTNGNVGGK
jgi:uncharacterized protein (DUF736 family)